MKIVIDTYPQGRFWLSPEAVALYNTLENGEYDTLQDASLLRIPRDNLILIKVVETLGVDRASGDYCELKVVEIPDGTDWQIDISAGIEHVAEKHRTWF